MKNMRITAKLDTVNDDSCRHTGEKCEDSVDRGTGGIFFYLTRGYKGVHSIGCLKLS